MSRPPGAVAELVRGLAAESGSCRPGCGQGQRSLVNAVLAGGCLPKRALTNHSGPGLLPVWLQNPGRGRKGPTAVLSARLPRSSSRLTGGAPRAPWGLVTPGPVASQLELRPLSCQKGHLLPTTLPPNRELPPSPADHPGCGHGKGTPPS